MKPLPSLPEGYVAHFPTKPSTPIPHSFADPIPIPPEESVSHHEEVQRRCTICGAVRVTIMPKSADAYVEWRESFGLPWPVAKLFGCAKTGGKG